MPTQQAWHRSVGVCSLCILLAEDESLIREAAQVFLEEAGHEVLAAEHGREAIEHLDNYPGRFTCLVMDYHMPHFHGGEVIEHLRKVSIVTPVILASAFPHATTPHWRGRHRVSLLLKPYPMTDLVSLVGRLVA